MTNLVTEEWEKLVKGALKDWHRSVALSQHPLADLTIVGERKRHYGYPDDMHGRAKALRDVLRQGIQAIGVDGSEPPHDDSDLRWLEPDWRHYGLLTLLYVKGLSRGEVQDRIGLAEGGQYYRDQSKALAMLAAVLREWEGLPSDEAQTALLTYPSGAVPLADTFYVSRKADADLQNDLRRTGITATIRGPRQAGKTSLLIRGIQWARQNHQAEVVYMDLQGVAKDRLSSLDAFLREVAECMADEVGLDPDLVEQTWASKLGAHRKATKLLSQQLLERLDRPILLAIDEIDRLLYTGFHNEFFGLLRSWHNRRAHDSTWNKLNILMAISTEPYLLIDDLNQSPFNVGLTIYLDDFSPEQVADLNRRYGSPLTDGELPDLMRLLSGQPYLTRVALYTMARDELVWDRLAVNATSDQGPFGEHLRHQQQLLNADPSLKNAMSEILAKHRCSDESARFRLLKAGLVKNGGESLTCRCELYRAYFETIL